MFSHRVRLFTLFGFEVNIDASWLLLAVLVTWTLAKAVFPSFTPGFSSETYWWMGVAAALGLFFSIIFHEMSHSLVARRYGMSIRGITLFIFGGVAEMEGEPVSARGELLMAAAGPAASIVLALAFALLARVVGEALPEPVTGVIWYLALINGVLALFNLIPAFPLDGGRMLRAGLWAWRGDITWATRMAAGAGDIFGIILIALGVIEIILGDFVGGMWRFLIGLFLRSAAASSYQQTLAQKVLTGVSVAQVMTRQPIAVSPELSIAAFIDDYVYRYHHRSFPVVREGLLVGHVGTREAAATDRASWPVTPLAQIMVACSAEDVVTPEVDALKALAQMQRGGRSRLFVVREGRLIGILSLRDMLESLSSKIELEGGHPIAVGGGRRAAG
jgi:Zn-dependent protease/predicted transcriptional regulator